MKISKTLFKNLSRCPAFAGLYDLYINRNLHHIKTVNGIDLNKAMLQMGEIESFEEEDENIQVLLDHMFDEETGEDLTEVSNAQMEAMAGYFNKVEELAGEYIKERFPGKQINNIETKKQKKFSFSNQGFEYYCYLDIYSEGTDGKVRVFEVKATTSKKFTELKKIENLFNRHHSCGKYVYDLAVERFIIENSLKENHQEHLIPNFEYYLVVLNSNYIYDGTIANGEPYYKKDSSGNDLFVLFDYTGITKDWQDEIEEQRCKIEADIQQKAIDKPYLGIYCDHKKPTQCKFHDICFERALKPGSILEYMSRKSQLELKDKLEYINQGIYMLDSLDPSQLKNEDQKVQYNCYKYQEVFINDYIDYFFKDIKYPLYHLDFETFPCPLPRYFGEKPYTQSVFQFSLHIEKAKGVCDKKLDHYDYLAPSHEDCRRELVEKLIDLIDLSNGGSVIVYNQSFEKTRLKELAEVFPDLAEKLNRINDHVFDLAYLIKGSKKKLKEYLSEEGIDEELVDHQPTLNYYHNEMHGSTSIKKVLPLFTHLTYDTLDVKNGTEAILTYATLPLLSEIEYQEKYLALKEYCQQDTWAMVEILWGLWKLFNNKQKNSVI